MTFEKISAQDLNRRFVHLLGSKDPQSMEKLGELGQTWLENVVLERGFTRLILPPGEPVSPEDPQVIRSPNHEGLEYIIDLDRKFKAVKINFVSLPDTVWLSGERTSLNFFTIATPIFSYSEEQLLAAIKPVGKIIENDAASYIETVEDELTILAANTCVAAAPEASPQLVEGTGRLDRTHISALLVNMDQRRLKPAKLLMSFSSYHEMMGLDHVQLGDTGAWETFKDGYKHDAIMGVDLVLTNKEDIIPKGYVYLFTDQSHLGVFKILRNPRFYVEERLGRVEMFAKEIVCLGIKICTGVSKLVVTPT